MGKKLILTSNYSLSFWTDEYKLELENYLTQFFGEVIVLPTENKEPTKNCLIIVFYWFEIFKSIQLQPKKILLNYC